MRRRTWARMAALAAAVTVATFALCPARLAADSSRWGASYFPNIALTTQHGDTVHFYDLIKSKIVAIDLIYTTCEYNCPLETGRLAQVQDLLGDRMGRDVLFLSISIDPKHDTPAVLKTYADEFHAGPGWLFLTGNPDDVELLSKKLGLYSVPNPDNPDGHTPMLLVGNEATGQWIKDSALDNPRFVAQVIGTWTGRWQSASTPRSYAEVPPITVTSKGQYVFTTQCSACHTIGGGDKVGPDLAGITRVRDRGWLARYIAAPEALRDDGDPVAKALFAKYPTVRMPDLSLTESEAADIVAYVDAQSASTPGGARSASGFK